MGASLNYKKFERELLNGARAAFTQLRADHATDDFYVFAIYTTPEVTYVSPTASSEQSLRSEDQRWSPADWAYHLEGQELFAPAEAVLDKGPSVREMTESGARGRAERLIKIIVDVMRTLDEEGVFGPKERRDSYVLLIEAGDRADSFVLGPAEQLNPPEVFEKFAAPFALDPRGTFTEHGPHNVRTANALDVSDQGGAIIVAADYSLHRFDSAAREPTFKKRPPSDAYLEDATFSPDGRLIHALADIRQGEPAVIATYTSDKGQKRSEIALDPSWELGKRFSTGLLDGETPVFLVALRDLTIHAIDASEAGSKKGSGTGNVLLTDAPPYETLTERIAAESIMRARRHGPWDNNSEGLARDLGLISSDEYAMLSKRRLRGAWAFSPDRSMLAVSVPGPVIELVRVADDQVLDVLDASLEAVWDVAWLSPTGPVAIAAWGETRKPLILWDVSASIGA